MIKCSTKYSLALALADSYYKMRWLFKTHEHEINKLSYVKKNRALNKTPSQSYEMSLGIWDHTVLPVTRHK